jgi:hypothetical protein
MIKRKRNRYQFKWWHGVLGLVGLSMVLGTVQALAADGGGGPARGSYRNYFVEIRPSGVGYHWSVVDQNGEQLSSGAEPTSGAAYSAAQRYIDWYVDLDTTMNPAIAAEPLKWTHPAQRPMLRAAAGHGPNLANGRRSLLTTRPWDGSESWQDRWDRFTR